MQQPGTITYRYKKGNPVSWQVPIGSRMINKDVKMPDGTIKSLPKKVAYYPGSSSYFIEDNAKTDLKKANIWLEDQGNGFTEAYIDENDYILNTLMQSTSKYGVDYEIYDPNAEANKLLDLFDARDKANEKLRNITEADAKAMAFAIFEFQSMSWTGTVSKAKLREMAYEKPHTLLERINKGDYKAKRAAGGAYYSEIVESDANENFVLWKETGEQILQIPTGEIGVNVLAKHLATPDGQVTLQKIGEAMGLKLKPLGKPAMVTASMEQSFNREDIEEVRKEYQIATGKSVPIPKVNDKAWLLIKIDEARKEGANV